MCDSPGEGRESSQEEDVEHELHFTNIETVISRYLM